HVITALSAACRQRGEIRGSQPACPADQVAVSILFHPGPLESVVGANPPWLAPGDPVNWTRSSMTHSVCHPWVRHPATSSVWCRGRHRAESRGHFLLIPPAGLLR